MLKTLEDSACAELAQMGAAMIGPNTAPALRWGTTIVTEKVGKYELRYMGETGTGGLIVELWNMHLKMPVDKFVEGGETFFGGKFVGVLFGALLVPRSTSASGVGWRHLILAQTEKKVRECDYLSETTAFTHASHIVRTF
jgi:hypothetical protein